MKPNKMDTLKIKISDGSGATICKIKDDDIDRIKKRFNMFMEEKYQ